MITLKKHLRTQGGFTLVELLIVIVVIAILATLTIVAYNGIANRAVDSVMQNDLSNSAQLLEKAKIDGSAYPDSLANAGLTPSSSVSYQYTYNSSSNSYCLTATSSSSSDTYHISSDSGTVQSGVCPGHNMITGSPSPAGYTDLSNAVSGNSFIASIGSIPTGDWIIAIFSYTNNADLSVVPSGWTLIVPRHTTNTMQTVVYAKMKLASDSDLQSFGAAGSGGAGTTNMALLWGSNGAAISSWTIGTFGDRANNATSTTTLTPSISVPTAKSLILSISTERTIADETSYTSLTGVTPWFYIPQYGSTKLQTITVGYDEQASTGTSKTMTVTYPNPQTTNGTAIQVAIPPAS